MLAVLMIRPEPEYRRGAFERGLIKSGYGLKARGSPSSQDDLLVLWNYHPSTIGLAADWENAGGTVLVCENGYAGKDDQGRQYYAIAVHGHNGSGWFPEGTEDRFDDLNIEVLPWRTHGEHVLICGQRGIGSKSMASPPNWHTNKARAIRERPVKVRAHPGNRPAATRLEDDLTNAWGCYIWSSSAGIRALTLGIPVMYDAPHWICEGAAVKGWTDTPCLDHVKRMKALRKMAWGQRSVDEIESGEVFTRIRERRGEAVW